MTNLCLDIDILAAYIDGSLGDDEKKAAETHIASCDECMEEFVLATLLLNDEELAEYEPEYSQMSRQTDAQTALHEAGDTIRTKISDWLAALTPPEWLLPRLSFVRGSKDRTDAPCSIFIRKSINELQAEMYIEKNEDSLSSEQWRLWIKVFKNSEAAKNVSLTLMREDGLPYARFLNYGYVLFDRQPYGSYSLTVEQAAYLKSEKTEPFEKNVPYCFEINHAGFYEK